MEVFLKPNQNEIKRNRYLKESQPSTVTAPLKNKAERIYFESITLSNSSG